MSGHKPPRRRPGESVESESVPMEQWNLRMQRAMLDAIESEAKREGMPSAEFVRLAVAFRFGYLAAVEHRESMEQIEAMLRKILERSNGA